MRHLVAPHQSLPVAFGQRGEGASRPERISYVANSPLYASFLIAGADLAELWREVIVSAQFEQARVKKNVAAAPLQHDGFEIVVKNHARLSVPGLKGVDVTAQEVLRGLVEKELQVQGARIGQSHHKAGQDAAGTSYH